MTTDLTRPWIDPGLTAARQKLVTEDVRDLSIGLTPDLIPQMRALQDKANQADTTYLRRGGTVTVQERDIPGPEGAPGLPTLILSPASGTGPWPCLYMTNCGGKIIRGNLGSLTPPEVDWVVDLGIVIVVIAARVGPEDRHPAQVEDGLAGLNWVHEHGPAELNIDPDRIMLFGKSGGGGVAAATALLARDRGGPQVTHQLLVYPMIDDQETYVAGRFEGIPWDRTSNRTGWSSMLGDDYGTANVSPYAAPLRATDLAGLPPAYVEVGSADTFRDEDIAYAMRMGEAGVPVELHVWAGMTHGGEIVAPDVEVSKAMVNARTSYLRRAVGATIPA